MAAILVLLGVSVLSAAGGSAHVTHLYKALWGVSMLWMVRFRWRVHLPIRGPLFLIVIATVFLVVALRIITQLQPFTGPSIDTTSVGPVWLFTAAALAIPAALGHEMFFRGLIFDLVRRKGGVRPAVAVSGLLPAVMQLPFSPLQSVAWAAASGLLLSASRAITGSLAPALIARCILSLSGVVFIALVMSGAFSRGP